MKQFLLLFSLSFFLVGLSCDYSSPNAYSGPKAVTDGLGNVLGNDSTGGGSGDQGNNLNNELSLLKTKAEKGDAYAQLELGSKYFLGKGSVSQNYKEAAKWFSLAAKQGNAMAQYFLGFLYYQGEGVAQDYNEAFRLTKLSAEQRLGEAQLSLGVLHYYLGKGVTKDIVRAYMWISLSTANLSPENASNSTLKQQIQDAKSSILASMKAAQIAQARMLVTACKNKNYKNC